MGCTKQVACTKKEHVNFIKDAWNGFIFIKKGTILNFQGCFYITFYSHFV
jgi:hypothetical protein